jgi:hypothetical protein
MKKDCDGIKKKSRLNSNKITNTQFNSTFLPNQMKKIIIEIFIFFCYLIMFFKIVMIR